MTIGRLGRAELCLHTSTVLDLRMLIDGVYGWGIPWSFQRIYTELFRSPRLDRLDIKRKVAVHLTFNLDNELIARPLVRPSAMV